MTDKEITAEQLVEVLKFTPRTYTISMWGYGGEKVMGTVSQESWDYCVKNRVDLSDIAWNYDACEDMGLDEDKLPFTPGSWYECDSMAHVNGVSRDAGWIRIDDENNQAVYENGLEGLSGLDGEPTFACNDEVWINMREPGEIVFVGSSNEKGTFFEGEIALTAPFDIELLELQYDEVDGEEIINGVYYNGEEIDNTGGGTDGKSSDFNMFIVKEDNEWERYEVAELPIDPSDIIAEPTYKAEPEELVEFKFSEHKPVHVGWYFCVWRNGNTKSPMYWDGKEFSVVYENELCPQIQTGILTWAGLNWDTTDWSNCPQNNTWFSADFHPTDDGYYEAEYTGSVNPLSRNKLHWNGTRWALLNESGQGCVVSTVTRWRKVEPTRAEFVAMLDNALEELAEESGIDFDNESTVEQKEKSWPF